MAAIGSIYSGNLLHTNRHLNAELKTIDPDTTDGGRWRTTLEMGKRLCLETNPTYTKTSQVVFKMVEHIRAKTTASVQKLHRKLSLPPHAAHMPLFLHVICGILDPLKREYQKKSPEDPFLKDCESFYSQLAAARYLPILNNPVQGKRIGNTGDMLLQAFTDIYSKLHSINSTDSTAIDSAAQELFEIMNENPDLFERSIDQILHPSASLITRHTISIEHLLKMAIEYIDFLKSYLPICFKYIESQIEPIPGLQEHVHFHNFQDKKVVIEQRKKIILLLSKIKTNTIEDFLEAIGIMDEMTKRLIFLQDQGDGSGTRLCEHRPLINNEHTIVVLKKCLNDLQDTQGKISLNESFDFLEQELPTACGSWTKEELEKLIGYLERVQLAHISFDTFGINLTGKLEDVLFAISDWHTKHQAETRTLKALDSLIHHIKGKTASEEQLRAENAAALIEEEERILAKKTRKTFLSKKPYSKTFPVEEMEKAAEPALEVLATLEPQLQREAIQLVPLDRLCHLTIPQHATSSQKACLAHLKSLSKELRALFAIPKKDLRQISKIEKVFYFVSFYMAELALKVQPNATAPIDMHRHNLNYFFHLLPAIAANPLSAPLRKIFGMNLWISHHHLQVLDYKNTPTPPLLEKLHTVDQTDQPFPLAQMRQDLKEIIQFLAELDYPIPLPESGIPQKTYAPPVVLTQRLIPDTDRIVASLERIVAALLHEGHETLAGLLSQVISNCRVLKGIISLTPMGVSIDGSLFTLSVKQSIYWHNRIFEDLAIAFFYMDHGHIRTHTHNLLEIFGENSETFLGRDGIGFLTTNYHHINRTSRYPFAEEISSRLHDLIVKAYAITEHSMESGFEFQEPVTLFDFYSTHVKKGTANEVTLELEKIFSQTHQLILERILPALFEQLSNQEYLLHA